MVRYDLSDDLITAGAAFLDATDALGMRAEGAFWERRHDLDLWRLRLVTVLESEASKTDPYAFLVHAFPEGALPSPMTLHDVVLACPSQPLFRKLVRIASDAAPHAPRRIEDLFVAGDRVDVLVYRADPRRTGVAEAAEIARIVGERSGVAALTG